MTRRDSSPADDPPSNGQARQDAADDGQTPREGEAEGSNRKERVLHTRVPAVLERELKRFADNLRIPVSNLVRTILEDAVSVADRAGDRVEERLRTAAEHLGHERERLRKRVLIDPLADVFAFQPVTLAQAAECAKCGTELRAGTKAHLGLTDAPPGPDRTRTFVCDRCLPRPDAAAERGDVEAKS